MHEYTAVAFCTVGAEKALSNELRKLSQEKQVFTIIESCYGRVRFRTDINGLYRALLSLRSADRLLLEAGVFDASDFDSLFDGTASVLWEKYIPRGMGLKVSKVRSSASRLKAETSIQSIVHKAIAERLCRYYGVNRLPGGDTDKRGESGIKQAEVRVFIEKDKASILLDISGDPLFKRGYRLAGGIAPLRESTAAAILLLSGWRRKFPLYDPFCGSGTIVIEAALYAWDQAPGLGRCFTLSDLLIADKPIEDTIRKELTEKIDYSRPICINGSDSDEKAISLARTNLRRAIGLGKAHVPSVPKGAAFHCFSMKEASPSQLHINKDSPHINQPGFIITNPPYGNRLGEINEAEKRYSEMSGLCKTFVDWHLALICNHKGFESHFGKKADSCRELKTGAVDAWLYHYEKLKNN